MSLRDLLNNGPVLLDGAMGTYLSSITHESILRCENANIDKSEIIKDIYRQYIKAGAQVIKTNTYNANRVFYHNDEDTVVNVIKSGWKTAREIAEENGVEVIADIGPVTGLYSFITAEEYIFTAEKFINEGAKNFLFETNPSTEGILPAVKYIKENVENSFIIVTFAVQADGYTREGFYCGDLLKEIWSSGFVDAVGLNCICGAREMFDIYMDIDTAGMTVALIPGAGNPIVVNNRTVYDSDPRFFGMKAADMAANGVSIIGGCCGSTPEHIRLIKDNLNKSVKTVGLKKEKPKSKKHNVKGTSRFWERLNNGEKVLAVELDPPKDIDVSKFMTGASDLQKADVDIITLADCPVARVRMDSSLLACKLKRELNIEALPHMTCRDRNINATKALLLGLYSEGLRNVLVVTGDPVPASDRNEVKSVYQFNSRKMANYISSLSKNIFDDSLHVFGALNVNARNFRIQLDLAKQKEENGVAGFLTQPVLTEEGFENLKLARQELKGFILGGIIPVVSQKNAIFMNSEISGINVSDAIIDRYEGLDREQSEALAVGISTEIASRILPYTDGLYLITPFQRTNIIIKIIDNLKKQGKI